VLTVEEFGRIRIAQRDGLSVRAIARTYHHSRRKVREALDRPEPRPYTRTREPPRPKLGPFTAIIAELLAADVQAPPKQRHTRQQIFRRLRAEYGYTGGYDAVRRYIGQQQRRQRETFIPLAHDPGQRLECDFGHIYADFPDARRLVAVLIAVWAYSYRPFAIALPSERTEAILAGMVAAFTFFGCVPREVWWDNPTTVATMIYRGRQRRLNERYAALASHYAFEPLFCLPARGNEKPHVENRVFDLQRRWATPVPRVANLVELNDWLRQCATNDRERTVAGQTETIAQRFERDHAAAHALPVHAFDACIHAAAVVDKFQTVRFDSNGYSVPRPYAFTTVTIKGYVERVVVVAGGRVVAEHPRSYQRGQQILDPLHYLAALGRRPAALDHANVYRHWQLPAEFTRLRAELEQRHGPAAGARHYIRVLQLLTQHPLARIQRAIGGAQTPGELHADRIDQRVQRLAQAEVDRAERGPAAACSVAPGERPEPVEVPRPDLRCFNQLLPSGEPAHA
jgi:transposase